MTYWIYVNREWIQVSREQYYAFLGAKVKLAEVS